MKLPKLALRINKSIENRIESRIEKPRLANAKQMFLFVALCTTAFLSGCGFQLVGTAPEIQSLQGQNVYLLDKVSRQELVDTPVINQLQSDMSALNLAVSLEESNQDSFGILITKEASSEQSHSLTQALFNRHIEITKVIEYQIIDLDGKMLLTSNASASRDLFEDQSNPSAKFQERQKLIDLINQDISKEVINQLAKALTTTAEKED